MVLLEPIQLLPDPRLSNLRHRRAHSPFARSQIIALRNSSVIVAGSLSAVGLSRLRGVGSGSTSTTASGADLTTGPRCTVAFGTLRIPPSRSVALTCFPRGGSDTDTHPLQHLTSDVRICSAHVGIDALVSSDQPVTDVVLG